MATDLEDDTERITPNEVSEKTFHFHPESDVSEAEKLFPNKDKKVCSFTIFQSCNLLNKDISLTEQFLLWKTVFECTIFKKGWVLLRWSTHSHAIRYGSPTWCSQVWTPLNFLVFFPCKYILSFKDNLLPLINLVKCHVPCLPAKICPTCPSPEIDL